MVEHPVFPDTLHKQDAFQGTGLCSLAGFHS